MKRWTLVLAKDKCTRPDGGGPLLPRLQGNVETELHDYSLELLAAAAAAAVVVVSSVGEMNGIGSGYRASRCLNSLTSLISLACQNTQHAFLALTYCSFKSTTVGRQTCIKRSRIRFLDGGGCVMTLGKLFTPNCLDADTLR